MLYIITQAWKQQERDQEFINYLKSGATSYSIFKWPKVKKKMRQKTSENHLK